VPRIDHHDSFMRAQMNRPADGEFDAVAMARRQFR
jgi:hypothetical protein